MGKNVKEFLTIDDFELKGKTVLFRADINSVIIDGKVQMKERIKENAKTIQELSENKAKVVILAHQGRVGEVNFMSLEQHAELLRRLIDLQYIDDIIGPGAREAIKNLDDGEVLLLDNVRILAEESICKSPEEHAKSIFVRRLSPLADIYINDAFSVAHRSHASVVGFPAVMDAGIGRLMEHELISLKKAVHRIKRPCIYALGGVKSEEVFDIMEHILKRKKVDTILTSGALGTIFLYACGTIKPGEGETTDKQFSKNLKRARRILTRGGDKILSPEDVAVEVDGRREEIPVDALKPGQQIYDIGERTSKRYAELIKGAKTVVMKGPPGLYEKNEFRKGTEELLQALSASDAFVLIGGGHTSAAMSTLGIKKTDRTYVSLAGGAFLTYLLENHLPGIEVLKRR
ncbi:MAG: phosphoglycerate kinase [Halobacteriota archaeon]